MNEHQQRLALCVCCQEPAIFVCDGPPPTVSQARCDRPLCAEHVRIEPDGSFSCPEHQAPAARRLLP